MNILEVKNLKKIYTTRFGGEKVEALSNVNFTVAEGEYTAIMGESGSGKTTLLNILASLDKPTSGEKPPKGNLFLGIAGVLLLDFAYWLAVTIKDPVAAPRAIAPEPLARG